MIGGNHDAETLRDRPREVQAGAREDLVRLLVPVRVRCLPEIEILVVADQVERVAQLAVAAFERALADEVNRAGEGVGGVGGRGDFGDLDARNVVQCHRAHVDGARGTNPDVGGGRAVVGDRRHATADTAEGDAGDVRHVVLDGNPGQKLHELAHGAGEHVAELVGRHHVLDVRREALLVDRDGLRVRLALLGNDEGVELDGAVGGLAVARERRQEDILLDPTAGRHDERCGGEIEVGEEHLECDRPARHPSDAEAAVLVGEDRRGRALDRDAGVGQVLAGANVEHPTGDGGGGRDGRFGRMPGWHHGTREGKPSAENRVGGVCFHGDQLRWGDRAGTSGRNSGGRPRSRGCPAP